MVLCRIVVLLTTLAALSAGLRLQRKPVKRDSSSSLHIVDAPVSSYFVDAPSRHTDEMSSNTPPLSSVEVNGDHAKDIHDHNEVNRPKSNQLVTNADKKRPSGATKDPKRGKKSNEGLLHHLGMAKLRSPTINHHRKRLASQSRKTHSQKSNSDSKMFVIKLPPNPYYYAHHDLNGYGVVESQHNSVNKVPVNFKTNGKPSRVYHWNIPVLKKMVARKAGSAGKSAILADSDIFNIDKQTTWNETDDDKSVYRKAVFYGPKKQSKHTFRKYFAGNGKPHSFYVMEKSKTPSSIYRLLP